MGDFYMGEKIKPIDAASWNPKTEIGRMVKSGEITSLEQILDMGRPILEHEIADVLLHDMEVETLELKATQRVTDSGKRSQFRVVVVLGDRNGHVGLGVGKCDEVKPALECAVVDAKKNVIAIKTGCGSWECRCPRPHSVPQKTVGKEGSSEVVLKPAPRGIGLAANDVIKKVLYAAGIQDVWSFTKGGSNVYNVAMATMHALDALNNLKTTPVKKAE